MRLRLLGISSSIAKVSHRPTAKKLRIPGCCEKWSSSVARRAGKRLNPGRHGSKVVRALRIARGAQGGENPAPLYLIWVMVGVCWLWMKYTQDGLWVSFAAEYPEALDAAGSPGRASVPASPDFFPSPETFGLSMTLDLPGHCADFIADFIA